MGTRFMTSDSVVPDNVKQGILIRTVNDTVVTSVLDGVPQRVLRTEFAEKLIASGPVSRLARSVRSAFAFRQMSGTPWRDIIGEGLAMRKSHELSWSQMLMAANTPMMLRASSMVDGRVDLQHAQPAARSARRHRRAAQQRRAAGPDRRRGRRGAEAAQ